MTATPPTLCSFVLGALFGVAASAQVEGELRTIDGRVWTGSLAVAEDGTATLVGAAGTTTIDIAELQSFQRAGSTLRNVQTEDRVWLRSGLELPASKLSGRPAEAGKPARLVVRLPSGIDVELPIATLRAIRHGGLMRPQPRLFAADLAEPPANDDLIYVVKDGTAQRSSVAVLGFTEQHVDFLLRGDEYEFELDGLAAVVFGANTGFAPDRQPRPRTVFVLTTGERLEGKLVSLGERAVCRLDEGTTVQIPLRSLHRLEVSSDRLVWLSELQPDVEQTPAFDRVWPWQVDRSVAGPGFELGGRHFDRGIGMVPRTRLTYALDGRFDVFEAVIGIDDRGGPQAHAVFRVYADGRQVYQSEPKTLGMEPEPLRINLGKCRQLAIEVDFGKNYDLGDFCAFADARVVQR
ncbi:MAG TPA: hypothetical protein ENI87_06595 [bacterium]|nr:hypothetical protein [bacterium]